MSERKIIKQADGPEEFFGNGRVPKGLEKSVTLGARKFWAKRGMTEDLGEYSGIVKKKREGKSSENVD